MGSAEGRPDLYRDAGGLGESPRPVLSLGLSLSKPCRRIQNLPPFLVRNGGRSDGEAIETRDKVGGDGRPPAADSAPC
jgi:hypothetical protein